MLLVLMLWSLSGNLLLLVLVIASWTFLCVAIYLGQFSLANASPLWLGTLRTMLCSYLCCLWTQAMNTGRVPIYRQPVNTPCASREHSLCSQVVCTCPKQYYLVTIKNWELITDRAHQMHVSAALWDLSLWKGLNHLPICATYCRFELQYYNVTSVE